MPDEAARISGAQRASVPATGGEVSRRGLVQQLRGLSYDAQRAAVAAPAAREVHASGYAGLAPRGPVQRMAVVQLKTLDERLTDLGLTAQASALKAGFGNDEKKLNDYIDEVGEDKFKDLVLTKGLSAANLLANGGAKFYKTFIGCGSNTIAHVSALDGIDGGSVKGCHDEDAFRAVIDTEEEFEVLDIDLTTGNPKLAPIPQKEAEKYAIAKAKYDGQKSKRDEQIKNTGGSKIPEPTLPTPPVQQPAKVKVKFKRGRINSERDLSVKGVKVLEYELRKKPDGAWRGSSQAKTTIKGLTSNAGAWQTVCNEAIWDAIKKGAFAQSWSGTGGGAQIDGFYNGGDEVDTFFFVT